MGVAALLAPLNVSGTAAAEPASADCATLKQVETDLVSFTKDLQSHAESMSSALALDPDDPDRQTIGEILGSTGDMLQGAADDVTTASYRSALEAFADFFHRSARLALGEEGASPSEIKRFKEQGESLGGDVDTAYAHACDTAAAS
ncbi:MAG: hypothetical protein ACRC20_10580 [Segniliparus sp.]|uniref:hypothetical protein n=1 Tax=Segniliparus sp. TaxID=2804064 RepID=UPI003F3E9495